MSDNVYWDIATRCVENYKAGKPYPTQHHVRWPDPPAKPMSYCAGAARALYEEAHAGKEYPYAGGSAAEKEQSARRAGAAVVGTSTGNAFHTAIAKQQADPDGHYFEVGTQLYMTSIVGGENFGHVVTVVKITGPLTNLSNIWVFENTTAKRGIYAGFPGPGSIISLLKSVCGAKGSDRITSVVNVP